MRVSINLATRPYVELGPVYKRLRLLILALAILALPLWFLLHSETQKAAAAHTRLAASQQRLSGLQHEEQGYRSAMLQPANASVLRQSQFLNSLFAHKAFSWTAVMMDLEKVLPGGVQVENIDPTISRNGEVTIHLRVSGDHDRAVDFVRNLEHSRRFLSPRLADEAAQTNTEGARGVQPVSGNAVNMDILAEYNPLPSPEESKAASHHAPLAGSHPAAAPSEGAAKTPHAGQPAARRVGTPRHSSVKPSPQGAPSPKAGPR